MLERINLVPKKIATKKTWPLLYSALVLFMALGVLSLYLTEKMIAAKTDAFELKIQAASRDQGRSQELQTQVAKLKASIDGQENKLTALAKATEKFDKISREKLHYSLVLRGIAAELPESIKCTNIVIEESNGTISGVAAYYGELPEFVEHLKKYDFFASVSLQAIGQESKSQTFVPYSFTIVFTLRANSKDKAPWT